MRGELMFNYTNADYELLMIEAGFPKRYITAHKSKVDTGIWLDCWAVISDYKSLFLLGSAGTGKTYASAAIARELLEQHTMFDESEEYISQNKRNKIRYVDIISMLNDLRSSYDNKETSSADIINNCTNARYLILDDIGAEKISEWALDVLYAIINKRYGDMKATIFVSNISIDKLSQTLGARIASRIHETCDVVKFYGKRNMRI